VPVLEIQSVGEAACLGIRRDGPPAHLTILETLCQLLKGAAVSAQELDVEREYVAAV
jgi:hypothetical protein